MINEQGEYEPRDKRLAAISAQSKRLSTHIESCLNYAVEMDKMIESLKNMKISYLQEAKKYKTDHDFYVTEYMRRVEYLESRGERFKTNQ